MREFVKGYNLLREMGFSSKNVAEALAMYDNDTDKALAHFLNSSSWLFICSLYLEQLLSHVTTNNVIYKSSYSLICFDGVACIISSFYLNTRLRPHTKKKKNALFSLFVCFVPDVKIIMFILVTAYCRNINKIGLDII